MLNNTIPLLVALALIGLAGCGSNQVNQPPSIASIQDQTIENNGSPQSINLNISDDNDTIGELQITATSDNSELLPSGTISIEISGSVAQINLLPSALLGTANVTVNVTDTEGLVNSSSFVLTVAAEQVEFSQLVRRIFDQGGNTQPQELSLIEISEDTNMDDFNDLL